jgi:glycosyltransferase involved in cell wall biosynthesis
MPSQLDPALVVEDLPPIRHTMRIAVVTETYPPEVNGVALTLARVVEGLAARDHAVQLVRPRQAPADAPGASGLDDEVLLAGLPIPRYPNLRMGLPATRSLVTLWSLRRPDVVHVATEGPLGWSAIRAAERLKLPLVSDFRTNFHAYSRYYGVGWLRQPITAYLRRFHNRTACTMVPTPALRDELQRHGLRGLQVVPRGVETQRFRPQARSEALRAGWGADSRTLVVLCVARLAPEKNLGQLLEVFEAIRARQPARLVLVGDGPSRGELQRRCPEAVFAGMRSGEDLAAHYASADLFVFPSLTETYGNVTPEAMASGLAVVAFDHAAAHELIRHGESGLLAPPGHGERLRALALEAAGDAALRERLGVQARRAAECISWESIVLQVESVLREAAARAPRALAWDRSVPVAG